MSRTNANVRRRLLITLAAALIGCGSEDPTRPSFGEQLTVAEQVAVEAAFGKVADSLEARPTADDSLIADFTRIAARLVRLQGRYGTISVLLPGSATRVEMRAVGFQGSDPSSEANLVLAWEDLDVAAFTMKRALVMQSGGFASTTSAQMRYFDMTGEVTAGQYSGSGVLTFTAPSFTNNCIGLSNTATESCRAGQITAAAQADVRRGAEPVISVDWAATAIAGFEVIVK